MLTKRIRRWLLVGDGEGAAVMAGLSTANPYMTLYQLRHAAEKGDSDALTELVDFDRVRTNLKMRVRNAMVDQVPGTKTGLGIVGAALAGTLFDPMVDSMVSPQTIGSWVQGVSPALGQEETSPSSNTETRFRSWSEMTTTITHGNESLELVLTRDIIRWRNRCADRHRQGRGAAEIRTWKVTSRRVGGANVRARQSCHSRTSFGAAVGPIAAETGATRAPTPTAGTPQRP